MQPNRWWNGVNLDDVGFHNADVTAAWVEARWNSGLGFDVDESDEDTSGLEESNDEHLDDMSALEEVDGEPLEDLSALEEIDDDEFHWRPEQEEIDDDEFHRRPEPVPPPPPAVMQELLSKVPTLMQELQNTAKQADAIPGIRG